MYPGLVKLLIELLDIFQKDLLKRRNQLWCVCERKSGEVRGRKSSIFTCLRTFDLNFFYKTTRSLGALLLELLAGGPSGL